MSSKLHSPAPRADVLAFVGENLRRLRQRAGLSQVALAEASGISRRMIVDVEGGGTNISLSSLDRLGEALGASFVELVSDPAAHPERINAVAWRGGQPQSVAMLLGSVPARREAQLWSWTLAEGERYQAEPDPPGWHEMIVVTEGCLAIERAEGDTLVAAGAYVIFGSDQPYAYRNAHAGTTRFIRNVVS